MRIKYSPHARKRLRERKINQDEVLIVLHHPGNKIYASRNRSRNRIIANKKFNSYTLEVVYVIENEQTIIITLYYL
ncbi:MAG: DUF4258 domain-containing protein [Patescibacteria group bacterium]